MFEILSDDEICKLWSNFGVTTNMCHHIAIAKAQRDKDIRDVVTNLRAIARSYSESFIPTKYQPKEVQLLLKIANEYSAKLGGEG